MKQAFEFVFSGRNDSHVRSHHSLTEWVSAVRACSRACVCVSTNEPPVVFPCRFYSSPYSIATNRIIGPTSLAPYMHSPVSAYQVTSFSGQGHHSRQDVQDLDRSWVLLLFPQVHNPSWLHHQSYIMPPTVSILAKLLDLFPVSLRRHSLPLLSLFHSPSSGSGPDLRDGPQHVHPPDLHDGAPDSAAQPPLDRQQWNSQ